MRTSESYRREVTAHFHLVKDGEYSFQLSDPTRAGLRDLCAFLFDNGKLTERDKKTIQNFLGKAGMDLQADLVYCDPEMFRPLHNYLKGKSQSTSTLNIEVLAILTNFQQRPFSAYLKGTANEQSEDSAPETGTQPAPEAPFVHHPGTTGNKAGDGGIVKKYLVPAVILIIAAAVISIWLAVTQKRCMQWQQDRYVVVDCSGEGNLQPATIKPYDAERVRLREITPDSSITFFENEKPVVWYVKSGGIRFFNMDGIDPESGKELKPVTPYIVQKHVYTSSK